MCVWSELEDRNESWYEGHLEEQLCNAVTFGDFKVFVRVVANEHCYFACKIRIDHAGVHAHALRRHAHCCAQHGSCDVFYRVPGLVDLDAVPSLERLAGLLFPWRTMGCGD